MTELLYCGPDPEPGEAGAKSPPWPNSRSAAGEYGGRRFEPGGYEPRGYEPRGYEPRGYEPRGYEPRGYQPRGYQPRGVVARWLVADGSRVRLGEAVVEVSTARGRHRVSALATGTLYQQAREGELLVYGYPLGLIE